MNDLSLPKTFQVNLRASRFFRSLRFFINSMIPGLVVSFAFCSAQLFGQDQAAPSAPVKQEQEERTLPPASNITIETKDRVGLKCTFFAAPTDGESASGKNVIPFILIHDWTGSRKDLLPFAEYLQYLGHAVIVPDLRGHGESTKKFDSPARLDYAKFRKSDIASVVLDIERCKKYLVQRSNDGELNIDLLNVVAVGKSAVFAISWTISDWSWPNRGPIKQGKDVKALTLISPQKKVKAIGLNKSLKSPLFSGRAGNNLPTLIVWSAEDDVAANDSDWIYNYMNKGRIDLDKIDDPDERRRQMTLFKAELSAARYTGTELIRDNQVDGLWKYIGNFVETQVGSKRDDHRWQSRKKD